MKLSQLVRPTLLALFLVASGLAACGSDKVCTTTEVQACDANLNACIAQAPCNDATMSGYQACVDNCTNAHCACLDSCGSTCSH